jgi:hypothetical protein
MSICVNCLLLGYCRDRKTLIVKRDDLKSDFIRDVREFAFSLGLTRDAWHETLVNWLRDYRGLIINAKGDPVDLDTSVFETASIRDWFRDTCCTLPTPDGARYVRVQAQQRFIVLATILRATFPRESLLWGVRAANDN